VRKNNPARTNPCNCEHVNHFTEQAIVVNGRVVRQAHKRTAHRYMKVEAGEQWAQWVGHVCDTCATTCVVDYLVKDHVHGEGDCHR